ncbi:putative D-galacturonate reductase [Helianthus annuus]|nr:putative D-galacturonate reductase [Helianthus annuus]KAJ0897878.1 putative D-galacturonate reductase [Helianthus annuus]
MIPHRELGLEYVDLYLIHWPLKLNQDDAKSPITKESIAAINIKDVWEGMEKCQNLGLTKSIGVSNFYPPLIEELLSIAKIPPVVNQVEMNPLWQQKKLNDFCKKKDILLTGYSPLGAYNTVWGHNRVMECDVLQDIAKSRGKTVAQVSLRWMYEQGVSFVVKSFNIERMKQNLDIFEWSLTEEEVIKISRIPQQRHVYLSGTMLKEPHDVLAEIDAGLSY